MTVLKRGNSKYWYVQFQIAGRTIIRSTRTTDKKAASQIESQLRAQAHARKYLGHKPSLTLDEALSRYIATREGTPNHRNLIGHKRSVTAFLRGSKPFEDVTSEELEEFRRVRSGAGVSPQTIQHALNLVRCAWKLAKRQSFSVPDLNFPQVRLKKPRTRYLSVDEERKLLAELNPRREGRGIVAYERRPQPIKQSMQDAYDLVLVLLDTGARYGEIARLSWSQIDLDARLIRLWRPKVQNEGIIFMSSRVHEALTARHSSKASGFVFSNSSGGPRGYTVVSIRKALNRAGLTDCTIHTLRHTHATRLIQNGLSVYEVRAVLGHTDIKTTMRYAHLEQATVSARARDVIDQLNLPQHAAETANHNAMPPATCVAVNVGGPMLADSID